MRLPSVKSIRLQSDACHQLYPKEGTKLRKLFDWFNANKGKVVKLPNCHSHSGNYLLQLRDYYGCDIRRIKRGYYCFVGEWINDEYVSYIEKSWQATKQDTLL